MPTPRGPILDPLDSFVWIPDVARRPPWWQRHVVALVLVVALVSGSAGALLGGALVSRRPTSVVTSVIAAQPIGPPVAASQIVAAVEPAVVTITVDTRADGTTEVTAGTGMVLTPDGLVATNAHVVAAATAIEVSFDGQATAHPARVVGQDARADLAVLRVTGAHDLPTVRLGDSSTVAVGDDVLAIGNSLAMSGINTLTMTSSRGSTADNIGFAIPTGAALPVLNRLGYSDHA